MPLPFKSSNETSSQPLIEPSEEAGSQERITSAGFFVSQYLTEQATIPGVKTAAEKLHSSEKEGLGLKELYFEMYFGSEAVTRTGKTGALGFPEVDTEDQHIYVLLHGWTGTGALFSQVPSQYGNRSLVAEIIARDPKAVIIVPDGVGFGYSEYNQDLGKNLKDKCTIRAYSEQVEFILGDLLGIDKERRSDVHVMGHSMGGAATLDLTARGWGKPETNVAVAPALMASTEERSYGQITATYAALQSLLGRVEAIRKSVPGESAPKLISKLTGLVFNNVLARPLMGEQTNGDVDKKVFKGIMDVLKPLHLEQLLTKLELSSVVMGNLQQGVKPDEYTEGELERMAGCNKVCGAKDNLGGGRELRIFFPLRGQIRGSASPDSYWGTLYRQTTKIISNAGHYAPLFSPEALDPLFVWSESREKVSSLARVAD